MSSTKLTIQLYDQTGKEVKKINLNPAVFAVKVKESVVHQVAVAQMANSRVAIAHTKTRGEVKGGGRKPWKQKGTGRARVGSIRSPLWVGGGVTFGPRNDRNFSQKVNKKMKTKALFMCLSDKASNDLLFLLDKLNLENGKTREMVEMFKNFKDVLKLKNKKSANTKNSEKSTGNTKNKKDNRVELSKDEHATRFDIKKYKLSLLVILPKSDKKVFNAGRNLTGIKITTANSLNVVDLLQYEKVIIAEEGLKIIEKTYLK